MCSHAASMCEVLWHACSLCIKETCHTCAVMPPPCARYYGRHAPSVSRRHVKHVRVCRLHVRGIVAGMLPLYQGDMSNLFSYAASISRENVKSCRLHVSGIMAGMLPLYQGDMSHMCSYAASMCEVLWHACSFRIKETCQRCAVMPPPCEKYYGRHAPSVSRRHVTHVQLCRLHV